MSVPSQLLRAAVLSCLVLIVLNAGAQPTNGAEVRQTIPAPGTNETLCLMLPKSAGRPVDRETPSKPGEIWCRGLYDPIPGAKTPDEEKLTLNKWAKEQDDKPWLRFSTSGAAGSDPGEATEAVGDAEEEPGRTGRSDERLEDVTRGLAVADVEHLAELRSQR